MRRILDASSKGAVTPMASAFRIARDFLRSHSTDA